MPGQYTRTAIWLHWLVALTLAGQFTFGLWLDTLPRGDPARGWFINWHKTTGLMLAILIAGRLAWRWTHPPPALPAVLPNWQCKLAHASHRLLYGLMLGIPATGYVASNFSRYGVTLFGRFHLRPWGVDDRQLYVLFNQAHHLLAWILLAMVILHALAALWHGCRGRHAVLHRMVPWCAGGHDERRVESS